MVEPSDIKNTVKELMQINHIEKIALKDLMLKKKVGEGGQAKVYQGTLENHIVAVKVLEEVDWKCLAHEIVIIANLHHPVIPKFYGIVVEDKVLSLVFEYINGKTLDDYKMSEISDEERFLMIKDLASVLEYIHSNKFIHRDLKPENLMYDKRNKKLFLIDFGIAKVCTNMTNTKTRAKGTLHYLAPESLDVVELDNDDQIISTITPAVDVWAYGCIVSWLYSGILPWCNKYNDNPTVLQQVLMKKKPFPIPDSIKNQHIVNIINNCTQINESNRWTMSQVREYIENI
jgi:serine/threonine protein kinase